MGVLSTILHGAEIVGGVAAIGLTGGAATPWAAGLIAGGAGGLAQDFAGKKALKEQQQATTEARGLQDQALAQQKGLLDPYAKMGQGAMTNLASLMGGGFAAPSGGSDMMGAPAGPTNLASMAAHTNQATPPTSDMEGRTNVPIMQNPEDQNQSGYASVVTPGMRAAAGRQGNSSLVPVQTPDGRVVMVPPERISEATERGGKVLANA